MIIYSDRFLKSISWFMSVGGITLFPFIILKEKHRDNEIIKTHEKIHIEQQKEMLVIFFYIWYLVEFVLLIFKYKNPKKAYKNLLHEKEAKQNERNKDYLKTRKSYAWLRGA